MNLKALNKANIENLTGLWKKFGTQPSSCFNIETLNASVSWPNRYWFDWEVDINQIPTIEKLLKHLPHNGIVPIWGTVATPSNQLEQALTDEGFNVTFEQMAMYLNLESYVETERSATHITHVHSQQDIETWTKISGAAFGYEIDVSVIHKITNDPDIQLFLAYSEGQVAGTAMLYKTGDIIGVHQVGVVDKHQRKGIAFSLMQHVIETCNGRGKYITLQASEAGEVLYKRLGFKPQFIIRNYQRVVQ